MTRYEKGFIEKCAEYGVDGVALLKVAQELPPATDTTATIAPPAPVKWNWRDAGGGAWRGALAGLVPAVPAALGAGIGALFPGRDKKGRTHRARNALIGALAAYPTLGALGGTAVGGYARDVWSRIKQQQMQNTNPV